MQIYANFIHELCWRGPQLHANQNINQLQSKYARKITSTDFIMQIYANELGARELLHPFKRIRLIWFLLFTLSPMRKCCVSMDEWIDGWMDGWIPGAEWSGSACRMRPVIRSGSLQNNKTQKNVGWKKKQQNKTNHQKEQN